MFERWIALDANKSTLLTGPRRCGKTTLLKHCYPDFAYAILDDLDLLDWARRDGKGLIQSLGNRVILDEIQRHPPLTVAVKYAIDKENAHFLMTGSSTIGLLDAGADSLAGRINIRSLPTACWGENRGLPTHRIFEDAVPFPQLREAERLLPDAIRFGQFPEILTADSPEKKQELLKNYRDTYFTRDLMQLTNIENLDGLMALYLNVIRSIGSSLEVSNLAREAGISFVTAKKYLNSLLQSQLTFKLAGYQYGPAKRYTKAAKTYLADMGIAQGFRARLSDGQAMENFVIAELEKRRKLGFIPADRLYHYRSAGGREVDVVFETDKFLTAIEIKCTKKPSRRDTRNLEDFAAGVNAEKAVRCFLFYSGLEYQEIGNVNLLPIAALYRGK